MASLTIISSFQIIWDIDSREMQKVVFNWFQQGNWQNHSCPYNGKYRNKTSLMFRERNRFTQGPAEPFGAPVHSLCTLGLLCQESCFTTGAPILRTLHSFGFSLILIEDMVFIDFRGKGEKGRGRE